MLYFDEVDVKVNGSGILAESASVSTTPALETYLALGCKGPFSNTPAGGIKTSFQFDYFVEMVNDQAFNVATGLRNSHNALTYSSVPISIAGISGEGYLESYSIRYSQNDLAKASATFICFSPVSGNLISKSNLVKYNPAKYSGLVNFTDLRYVSGIWDLPGWSYPILDFTFAFNAEWEPVYIVGSKNPSQVQLHSINERVTFTSDKYYPLVFSGNESSSAFGFHTFLFRETFGAELAFPFSGGMINSEDVQVVLDDIVRVSTTITNSF